MQLQLTNFLKFYKDVFLPVYSDAVAYLADKPIQIIIEVENAFAHIVVFLDETNSSEVRKENLKKAYNHIARAALDSYKILWVKMSEDIDEIVKDEYQRKFTVNIPEHELLKKIVMFKEKAKEARRLEIYNIGQNNITKIIEAYSQAISNGWEILKNIDHEKLKSYKKFSLVSVIKRQWIGIIIGVVSSTIFAFIAYIINNWNTLIG